MASPDDTISRLSELLHRTGEIHHTVYAIVDGDDPDWASWYAEWLITLSPLPDLLGTTPVNSELVYMLVRLDKEYQQRRPSDRWQDYYARALFEHFTGGS